MKYQSISQYEQKIQEKIANKGGILITSVVNSKDKVQVKCGNDHLFLISPNKIIQNRWCPFCRRVPFDRIQKYVNDKSGSVSGNFIDMTHKINFTCQLGHMWRATPASVILQKTWCPVCAKRLKINIDIFHAIAKNRGGKCLTNEYNTQQDKLKFQCANNHVWEAKAHHIKSGHWCPKCHIYKGEEIVRLYLEKLFHNKFPKYRADWLVNDQGNKLELDGYCSNLGIAFEHNGKQHYGFNLFRINNFDNIFEQIKYNDRCKEKICEAKGVKLIKIAALGDFTKIEDLPKVCLESIKSLNITQLLHNVSLNDIIFSVTKKDLEEIRQIAINHDGKCLSNVYMNSKTHLIFECKIGHQWKCIPANIKKGSWCPICNLNKNNIIILKV